jgi:hypothetical protein
LLAGGEEGLSEIDVIIEWVWFIEAKHKSDIRLRTTTRPGRDQVLRNIDVESYYAGARPPRFECPNAAASRRFDYDFCRGRILAAAKNMQAIKKPMTM